MLVRAHTWRRHQPAPLIQPRHAGQSAGAAPRHADTPGPRCPARPPIWPKRAVPPLWSPAQPSSAKLATAPIGFICA